MPQNDPENDLDDAFPIAWEDTSVRRRPTKTYKTTGEDDDDSTNTSGTKVEDEEAKPGPKPPPPNTKLLHDFRHFCDTHYDNFFQLTQEKKTSIQLMHVFMKRAPMSAYEAVLEWHLRESGQLHPQESSGALADAYPRRETLMSKLIPRYNLGPLETTIKKVNTFNGHQC